MGVYLERNSITALRNGSFYDFPSLRYLGFQWNHINVIEPDVFLQSDRLQLETITLANNTFVNIDSWPVALAKKNDNFGLFLDGNSISKITNHGGIWSGSCDDQAFSKHQPLISLTANKITHIMYIFKGWNFNIRTSKQISDCMELLGFDLTDNPLNCDCVDYDLGIHQLSK